jgi:hypothetical protein
VDDDADRRCRRSHELQRRRHREPFEVLDLSDINLFVSSFQSQSAFADLDGNGIYDLTDISLFVNSFTAGCP